jgi:heptaprenyl diphosphate synthase
MPALLFNPDTKMRVAQFLFFFFLAWLAGKKTRPLITLAAIGGIILFNLLAPYGEILFSLGPLQISSGALLAGVRRAVTLEGLLMISRASVRPDLRLPGGFGKLAGETLRLFARLSERKKFSWSKNWAASIDGLLLELDAGPAGSANPADTTAAAEAAEAEAPAAKTTLPGYIILAAALILAWTPLQRFV